MFQILTSTAFIAKSNHFQYNFNREFFQSFDFQCFQRCSLQLELINFSEKNFTKSIQSPHQGPLIYTRKKRIQCCNQISFWHSRMNLALLWKKYSAILLVLLGGLKWIQNGIWNYFFLAISSARVQDSITHSNIYSGMCFCICWVLFKFNDDVTVVYHFYWKCFDNRLKKKESKPIGLNSNANEKGNEWKRRFCLFVFTNCCTNWVLQIERFLFRLLFNFCQCCWN